MILMKTTPRDGELGARSPRGGTGPAGAVTRRAEAAVQTDYLRAWMHQGLHDLPHDSSVLALGCEEVFLAPHLAEYSAEVTVLDTSGGQLAQLARRFPEISFLQHNPSRPLPFGHDSFDAIWCCEYLDRVFDPAAVLEEMHRVLTPGGRLMITVPDHGTVRNVLIALFNWDEHFAPTNPRIRHFTRGTLGKLVRESGFEQIRTTTGGSVRRIAGGLVPRTLLLQARKGPAVRPALVGRRTQREEVELIEDFAFASRMRAA
jgi:ubiquinone/menaquinone biosynthesis C-methylase UbiE